MAEGKKSFVLYCDLIHKIDHLTTEEKGRLFQHLLEYVNDMNPELDDRVLLGSWKHIEHQLKVDLRKYQEIRERNRENARKRWDATASDGMQPDTRNADNGTDTVTDTDTGTEKEKKDILSFEVKQVIDYLNDKSGSSFKHTTEGHASLIRGRLGDGATVDELKSVIDLKVAQWKNDPKMSMYLRPQTLFNATKFEGYLSDVKRKPNDQFGHKYNHERIYEHEYWMDRIIRNKIDPRDTEEVQLFLKEEGVDVRSSRTVQLKFESEPEKFPYVTD